MNPDHTLQDNAALLRIRLRAARRALPEAERRHGALRVRALLYTWLGLRRDALTRTGQRAPQVIAAYWPLADEPDLRPLLAQWVHAGLTVALPVIVERQAPLRFRVWTPQALMQTGAYGIAEPQSGIFVVPDVLLVPTLGYTGQAERLGYGGGYYDRTLAALRAQNHPHIALGIAWSCSRIGDDDGYQAAAHDERLDAVLTSDGWVPAAP